MSSTPVLNTTLEALTVISDFLDYPQMPMQLIRTFCYVAARDELPMSELGNLTGVSQAAVSRNVAQLGPGISRDKPGHLLLEAYEDLDDRRHKRVRLTDKGKKLLMEMESKVSPKMRAAMGLKPYNISVNLPENKTLEQRLLAGPAFSKEEEEAFLEMVHAEMESRGIQRIGDTEIYAKAKEITEDIFKEAKKGPAEEPKRRMNMNRYKTES